MKKFNLFIASILCIALLAGCGGGNDKAKDAEPKEEAPAVTESDEPEEKVEEEPVEEEPKEEAKANPVDLVVVTSYGGDDAGRGAYEALYKQFEEETGNRILDNSATADDAWRAKVNADFQTGAEPDVLFYFTGPDIDPIKDKVMTIDEIRAEYPDYADNMKDDALPVSPDGNKYGIPVIGNWEAMFTNKAVLEDSGVALPGPDYTWDQFLEDCEAIKTAGYTPIAASLTHIPHYWFEFAIYNHGSPETHAQIPADMNDPIAQNWINGLNDIKDLYERGYFPANTMTAQDSETWQIAYDDKAAFAADGSWKIDGVLQEAQNPDNWVVSYVPSTGGDRKTTDIIAGISMGYMVTQKAWEDDEKRDAAVDFIEYMTTREAVSEFSQVRVTALKEGVIPSGELTPLEESGRDFSSGNTGTSFFLGDMINVEARTYMMENIKNVCTGTKTAAELVEEVLDMHYSE